VAYLEPADRLPNCPLAEVDRKRRTRDQTALLPSRPGEFHPEPLTDPDVTLSRHPARASHEGCRSSRYEPVDPSSGDNLLPSLHAH
jgi:hypothetical protein